MRYRLRTLLIVLALGPVVLWGAASIASAVFFADLRCLNCKIAEVAEKRAVELKQSFPGP